jgi:hypothetical protein
VVEHLPYNHIYRNPNYKPEELKVKDSTDKSMVLDDKADLGFRGKILAVEASIPKKWYTAGETVPITIQLTPTGYKKVKPWRIDLTIGRLDKNYFSQSRYDPWKSRTK